MTVEQKKGHSDVRLIEAPRLWELEFRRSVDKSAKPDGGPLTFELGFGRPGEKELAVHFGVEVNDVQDVTLKAAFRGVFAVDTALSGDDLTAQLKIVGAHVATGIIYPFLREAIAVAAQRGGIREVVLPILNFRDFYSLSEIEIPPVTPEGTLIESGTSVETTNPT